MPTPASRRQLHPPTPNPKPPQTPNPRKPQRNRRPKRYKKQKHVCEAELGDRCEMGGFTRLLHSGQPDDLMHEVPTFVAAPLPESVVAHEWYPVLNRPWAFAQWVAQVRGCLGVLGWVGGC